MLTLLLITAASALTVREAIRAQQGCYKVTFQYADTETLHEDYAPRPPKRSEAIEWVHLEADSQDHIILQHVLVSGPAMIKHWRQEWRYEETAALRYEGRGAWRWEAVAPEAAAGTWTQIVTNVDDAPRYTCAAVWELRAQQASWSCTTPSPLPRREKDLRHDYDILERTNTHHISPQGWVHEQHNTRVRLDGDTAVPLSTEYGFNTYERIPDDQCQEAIDWWPGQRAIWGQIQAAWGDQLQAREHLTLHEKRAGMPLWVRLFLLARRAERRDLSDEDLYAKASRIIERHLR